MSRGFRVARMDDVISSEGANQIDEEGRSGVRKDALKGRAAGGA